MVTSIFACETCGKVFHSSSGRLYHAESTGHKFADYTPHQNSKGKPNKELAGKVQALLAEGFSPVEIANKLNIGVHIVYYYRAKEKKNGTTASVASNGAAHKGEQASTASGRTLNSSERNEDALIAYIFGRTQSQIEQYAKGVGLPETSVTRRVGELLRRS